MGSFFWYLIFIPICSYVSFKLLFSILLPSKKPTHCLPPGPPALPIVGSTLLLRKPFSHIEPVIKSLHEKFGPIIRLQIGPLPFIFIKDHALAHEVLIRKGAVFADRPKAFATERITSSNQHNITSAPYGATWRLLRRNLTSEILHPLRIKSYSHARTWVLQVLLNRLGSQSKNGGSVRPMAHFQHAMFSLLCFMCFGDKLEEAQIEQVEEVVRNHLLHLGEFNFLNFFPSLTKIIFRKRWECFLQLRKDQEDVLIPLITERKNLKEARLNKGKEEKDRFVLAYVDTLLDLQHAEESRNLTDDEMVTLCYELLAAGTDTSFTALQWIMANLVKNPEIQEKLFVEMKGVVGDADQEEVKEDDLQNMPYLKAVVYEALRIHPPAHYLLTHAATEDVVLDKFVIPKKALVNFLVAEIGRDPRIWEDPMAFKPERFLGNEGEAFDITGTKEIKMMPFGAGRRFCPGYGVAMLHLEYFVANLVWAYEWKPVDGDDVDLTEKLEFAVVMENPLQVHLLPRLKNVQ